MDHLTITIVIPLSSDELYQPKAHLIVADSSDRGADAYTIEDLYYLPGEIRRLLAYHMLIEGNVH